MFSNVKSFNRNAAATDRSIVHCEELIGSILPQDFQSFLRESNGGEGFIGRETYVILWSTEEIVRYNREYEVNDYCPELLLIGSNGSGEAYAYDRRASPWCVVQVPLVGMDYELCEEIGSNFDDFIQKLSNADGNT